jgi:hypothetical protein
MSVASLTPRVRTALGVSDSYDAEEIPAAIRRSIQRLLRDYHFPKMVKKHEWALSALEQQEFALPAGFKKDLQVRLYDFAHASIEDRKWSEPLRKLQSFTLPPRDRRPRHYWLEGVNLVLDTPVTDLFLNYKLQLYYESQDLASNESWITADFEDTIFYMTCARYAIELQKPETAQSFAVLWEDERASLAIYLNELEFNNYDILMHAPGEGSQDRYPDDSYFRR